MNNEKKKIIILSITLANIIVFLVISAVFLPRLLEKEDNVPVGGVPDEATHSISRSASPSLSPFLDWELSVGGSSNDELKEVFNLNGLFLFGQTLSTDYDFKGASGTSTLFCARATVGGSLISVTTFGSSGNDFYVKAAPSLNYFAVLYNSSINNGDFSVALIGYDGTPYKTKSFGTNETERGMTITTFDEYIVVVVESVSEIGKISLRVLYLDEELNVVYDRRPYRTASLTYVSIFQLDVNTLLLTANAVEGMASYAVLYKVRCDVPPVAFDQQKTLSHTALDCQPDILTGKIALLYSKTEGNTAFISLINWQLAQLSNISLNSADVSSGALHIGMDGLYASLVNKSGVSTLKYLDTASEQVSSTILQFDSIGEHYASEVSNIFVLTLGNKIHLIALQKFSIIYNQGFATDASKANALIISGASVLIFGTVEGINTDVTVQYGKKDIWLAKVS